MQKILFRCIISVFSLFIVIVLSAAIAVYSNGDKEPAPEIPEATTEALYTLCEYDGRIALYKSGYSMPVEIYDVYLYALPETEQKIISAGITASSDEEAQRLIEDYTS